ncbi:MAG TPA: metallopeptidase TldD-related protein, partial [Acetomicrobium sp.]|nr:metallopeptidase TldD-related protein [Acetomicrobium sp.]
ACGHALEGDIVYKDYSLFKDKIGEEVASSAINLIDDATIKDAFGSYKYDDEGTPSQRTTLIENGILKAYLSDVFCNKMWGLPLTGNGRRESYMRPPTARMSNTFLLPGSEEPEKIISRVQYGLFAKKMGGGETNPTSGDFVFHVDEGYLIEDGEVTVPVKGAILVGNSAQVLKNTLAVGNDLGFDVGLCGKNGQYVPVTDGQPTILIKELVVGGSDI